MTTAPSPQTKTGICRCCKVTREAVLHKRIQRNQAEAYQWICSECKTMDPFLTGMFIKKERVEDYLTPEQIEALPLIMAPADTRCVKCGQRGAELHHWAPRAIFGNECEDWPKDYLCKSCHDVWHNRVTPDLCQTF